VSKEKLQTDENVADKERQETREPSLYRVVLLNDDYTTMEFVIHVLEKVFHKSPEEATQIMLSVHKKGAGICGVYTREIAETKVVTVHELAARKKFPLKCTMEKE
jgi:ATP-dependent Clp protease adaptor protein ClpS